jgi:hypothetical protein
LTLVAVVAAGTTPDETRVGLAVAAVVFPVLAAVAGGALDVGFTVVKDCVAVAEDDAELVAAIFLAREVADAAVFFVVDFAATGGDVALMGPTEGRVSVAGPLAVTDGAGWWGYLLPPGLTPYFWEGLVVGEADSLALRFPFVAVWHVAGMCRAVPREGDLLGIPDQISAVVCVADSASVVFTVRRG